MKIKWPIALVAISIGWAISYGAMAQLSSNGGPVDISADALEVVDAKNLAIYSGHVDVIQGDARLQANKIEVQFGKAATDKNGGALSASWGRIRSITAIGDVFYTTPGEVARGDKAIYQLNSDTITMTGDVVVTQDGNVIRSNKLVINVSTGEAVFEAKDKGRRSSNRVRSVFFPKKAENPE